MVTLSRCYYIWSLGGVNSSSSVHPGFKCNCFRPQDATDQQQLRACFAAETIRDRVVLVQAMACRASSCYMSRVRLNLFVGGSITAARDLSSDLDDWPHASLSAAIACLLGERSFRRYTELVARMFCERVFASFEGDARVGAFRGIRTRVERFWCVKTGTVSQTVK